MTNNKREWVLTPYQGTAIMNAHRRELGLKEVKSPFMYIQANKGRFTLTQSSDGRKMIANVDEFFAWIVEHNTRQLKRRSTAQDTQKVNEFAVAICS